MENLEIAGTSTSPQVSLNFESGICFLAGESYSEESSKILVDVSARLAAFLAEDQEAPLEFSFSLQYFNSSSTRSILRIIDTLDSAAQSGRSITIKWHYRSFDEDLEEMGEEFGEDVENAAFIMVEESDD